MSDLGSPTSPIGEIVAAIHTGVFERPYWSAFLAKVRRHTEADYASLSLRRAEAPDRDIHIMKSGDSNGTLPPQYSGVEALRLMRLPYEGLEENRPYALDEIVDRSDSLHIEYLNYLKTRRIIDSLVVRVTEPRGGSGWLTICRAKAFSPEAAVLLNRIAPHLSIAVRTVAALERERERAEIAVDALHRLNFGWLTLDARARVIEIDDQATRLFRDVPCLKICTVGRVFPLGGAGLQILRETLSDIAEKRRFHSRAIHLVDRPWLDMMVAPVGYRAVSGGPTPVAVGYVHGAAEPSVDRCDQLTQLFGLTNSEARLALALSRGRSIAEAAEDLNLTVETARNYSKKVYTKTDARGQADLVRIILAGVLALA